MLNSNVLVLNKVFQAVEIVSARRAFTLFCKGHVRAVLEDYRTCDWEDWKDIPVGANDEYVSTPSRKIKVPRVILLLSFDRVPRHDVKFSRKNVYLRDKNRCQYCRRHFRTEELNLDHVIPVSRGGKSTWDNVVCSCIRCNIRKGNRLPDEAGLVLVTRPSKPRWHPLVRVSQRYEEWRSFLDEAYWNAEIDVEGAGL
jgi:5-methylcytosine-specific restriction endonuclease McrA